MRRLLKTGVLRVVVYVLFAGWMAYLLWDRSENATAVRFEPMAAFGTLVTLVVYYCAKCWLNKALFLSGTSFDDLVNPIRLTLVNTLGNLLPVPTGPAMKGFLLWRAVEQGPVQFVLLTAWMISLCVAATGLWGLVAGWLAFRTGVEERALVIAMPLFAAASAAPAILILLVAILARSLTPPRRQLYHWFLSRMLASMPCAIAAAGLIGTSEVVRLFYVSQMADLPIGLLPSAVLAASVTVAGIVSITPAGIGVREMAGLLIGPAVGLTPSDVFFVIGVDRIICLAFFGCTVAVWWLFDPAFPGSLVPAVPRTPETGPASIPESVCGSGGS